jgi:hypothetical protein
MDIGNDLSANDWKAICSCVYPVSSAPVWMVALIFPPGHVAPNFYLNMQPIPFMPIDPLRTKLAGVILRSRASFYDRSNHSRGDLHSLMACVASKDYKCNNNIICQSHIINASTSYCPQSSSRAVPSGACFSCKGFDEDQGLRLPFALLA